MTEAFIFTSEYPVSWQGETWVAHGPHNTLVNKYDSGPYYTIPSPEIGTSFAMRISDTYSTPGAVSSSSPSTELVLMRRKRDANSQMWLLILIHRLKVNWRFNLSLLTVRDHCLYDARAFLNFELDAKTVRGICEGRKIQLQWYAAHLLSNIPGEKVILIPNRKHTKTAKIWADEEIGHAYFFQVTASDDNVRCGGWTWGQ